MDAILPTPTYHGQVVFYWSKSLAFHSEGGAPRGDSGGEGVGGCSRPLWNGGGWWYPDAAGQTQGHRNAEQVLATELGAALGVGFAAAWRKGSQGQCALETGQGELGRLWGW